MIRFEDNGFARQQRSIFVVAVFLLGLFAALMLYMAYVQIWQADALNNNSHNHRSYYFAEQTKRGDVLDRNGIPLARSVADDNGKYVREYPFGVTCATLTGYYSARYGKTGVEAHYDSYLSGASNPWKAFGPVARIFQTGGETVLLNVDADVQRAAYRALGDYNGAVVALNPKTGAVICWVSKPAFNPNFLDSSWSALIKDGSSPLLDRVSQGMYPPGSTIKVMMALESLHYGTVDMKKTIDCTGKLKIGDYVLVDDDNEQHGEIGLKDALRESCNIFFGQLALNNGRGKVLEYFRDFRLDKNIPGVEDSVPANIPDLKNLGDGDLAQTGIGQGELLMSPLQMALVAEAVANNGVVMEPQFVKQISINGKVVTSSFSKEFFSVADKTSALRVNDMMQAVVDRGTGRSAGIYGVQVAGKTGTAQNPHGQSHSWFIGFAPADNPRICVAVIAENAGYGADIAAHAARVVIQEALGR